MTSEEPNHVSERVNVRGDVVARAPAEIVEANVGVHSFDVFDTVLTRLVAHPESVFLLVGEHARKAGHWALSPERFKAARIDAESRARAHLHPREIRLAEIYAELGFAYGISGSDLTACAEIELDIESRLLVLVPAARLAIEQARRSRKRVAFLSDMYLPEATVRAWLLRAGAAEPSDPVWVSSETGSTKVSGNAFAERARLVRHPGLWEHVGDHSHADVAVPLSMGIKATHWTACSLTRYENELERHSTATGAISSLLGGGARWLRLSHPASGSSQAALKDIAAGVAGPVLWAFVTWVLNTAAKEGLHKIWFTARDGQVLLRMARRIAPKLGIDIPMGYLYGGRQVVHLAGLRQFDERALKWLTGGAGMLSADSLLERAGLTVERMADSLRRHGLPLEGPIGWERVPALELFYQDAAVQAEVIAIAGTRREEMREYFAACGLMGQQACAVVDIGWRGSVLRSLFNILGEANGSRHHFLYFGLFGRPGDAREARMSAFCFDASGNPKLGSGDKVSSLMAVMEIFCQADHPQVVHVAREGGEFVPVLRQPPVTPPTLWDVPYFQDCLEAFADAVRVDLTFESDADLRSACERLLQMLMTEPSIAEAVVLGSVQYVDDQGGTTAQPFAHAYGLSDCRELLRYGSLPLRTLAWWSEGAWALTPPATRFLLRAVRRVSRCRQAVRSWVKGGRSYSSAKT